MTVSRPVGGDLPGRGGSRGVAMPHAVSSGLVNGPPPAGTQSALLSRAGSRARDQSSAPDPPPVSGCTTVSPFPCGPRHGDGFRWEVADSVAPPRAKDSDPPL